MGWMTSAAHWSQLFLICRIEWVCTWYAKDQMLSTDRIDSWRVRVSLWLLLLVFRWIFALANQFTIKLRFHVAFESSLIQQRCTHSDIKRILHSTKTNCSHRIYPTTKTDYHFSLWMHSTNCLSTMFRISVAYSIGGEWRWRFYCSANILRSNFIKHSIIYVNAMECSMKLQRNLPWLCVGFWNRWTWMARFTYV